MMKKVFSILLAITFLVAAFCIPSAAAQEPDSGRSIVDVHSGDWFADYVVQVMNDGLFQGTSETTFSPYGTMTRGMFVTVLGRMAKMNEKDYQENTFEDVSKSAYYAPYVSWAVQKGIIKGTSVKTFSPEMSITREQAVLILSRYESAGYGKYIKIDDDTPAFTDIGNTSAEFQAAYKTLYRAAIIDGKSATAFDPTGNLTRGEAAKIIANTNAMLHKDVIVPDVAGEILFTLPSYWESRYNLFRYSHYAFLEGYVGHPGEPGFYGATFYENQNDKEGKGELFSIYIIADGDDAIKLFQDDAGKWLTGCTELNRVRFDGHDMTVILQKPTELQYDAKDPLLKRAYLRLEQDCDNIISSIVYDSKSIEVIK